MPRPYEIGTDLVANAYSAYHTYERDCIVADFGTALTFTTVSGDGFVQGVAIAPGIKTAMKALSSNTACLLYTSPSPRDRQKSRMPSSA